MLPTVRAEGLPPLPAALADALLPYASSRHALRLGWHPRERRLLIWTTFGNVGQIHAVAGPGCRFTALQPPPPAGHDSVESNLVKPPAINVSG